MSHFTRRSLGVFAAAATTLTLSAGLLLRPLVVERPDAQAPVVGARSAAQWVWPKDGARSVAAPLELRWELPEGPRASHLTVTTSRGRVLVDAPDLREARYRLESLPPSEQLSASVSTGSSQSTGPIHQYQCDTFGLGDVRLPG